MYEKLPEEIVAIKLKNRVFYLLTAKKICPTGLETDNVNLSFQNFIKNCNDQILFSSLSSWYFD